MFSIPRSYCGCLIEDVTDQHYFELYGNNELGLLNQVVNGGILLTSYQADFPEVIYIEFQAASRPWLLQPVRVQAFVRRLLIVP